MKKKIKKETISSKEETKPSNKSNVELGKIERPIEWLIPENMIKRYATNMTIQPDEEEFVISFFELKAPIFAGKKEQIEQQIKGIKRIEAECISQIIISPNRLRKWVKLIQNTLDKHQEQYKKKE